MFVKTTKSGYTKDGSQFAQGYFLILLARYGDERPTEYRALVRFTRMSQLGHFMMGSCQVGKHSLILSGSYGSDGLPINLPSTDDRMAKWGYTKEEEIKKADDIWNQAIPVPNELIQQWKNGGGWNSSGSEAKAMRQWALENFKERVLTRA